MKGLRYPVTEAERFWLWRMRGGWDQESAAAHYGVSPSTIRRWERGVETPAARGLHPRVTRITRVEVARIARRRSGLTLREYARTFDLSHVTYLRRERLGLLPETKRPRKRPASQ